MPDNVRKPQTWWQKPGDFIAGQAGNAVSLFQTGQSAKKLSNLNFKPLPTGLISVSASTAEGTRREYTNFIEAKEGFRFPGGSYTPLLIAERTSEGLLHGVVSKSSLVFTGLVAVGVNLWDFGKDAASLEDFSDKTVENQKFRVSTSVDFLLPTAIGLASALTIGGLVVLGATLGLAAAPLTLTLAATAGLSFIIGSVLENTGVTQSVKSNIDMLIDVVRAGGTEILVQDLWSSVFNSSTTPAQPPIPAPTAPILPSTPTATPSVISSETPTVTPIR